MALGSSLLGAKPTPQGPRRMEQPLQLGGLTTGPFRPRPQRTMPPPMAAPEMPSVAPPVAAGLESGIFPQAPAASTPPAGSAMMAPPPMPDQSASPLAGFTSAFQMPPAFQPPSPPLNLNALLSSAGFFGGPSSSSGMPPWMDEQFGRLRR